MQDFYKLLRDLYLKKEKPPRLEKAFNAMKEVQYAFELRTKIENFEALKDFVKYIEFYRQVEIEYIVKFGFENGLKVGMELGKLENLIPDLNKPKLLQEIIPSYWRNFRAPEINEPFDMETLFTPIETKKSPEKPIDIDALLSPSENKKSSSKQNKENK